MGTTIHPTAIIEPGAELGKDVTVGPYSFIETRTQVGDKSTIGAYVQIKACSTIGRGNTIHSYAYIGGDPQDIKYSGADTFLTLGDNNIIREFATVHRGTENGRGLTSVGSDCMIMAYVHVAHDSTLGNGVILANNTMLAGHVAIGDYSVISGMCGIHQFATIGEYAFVGGMSGVSQDLPPYMKAAGARAQLHGVNTTGLRRSGMNSETISAIKQSYRALWREGRDRHEALESLSAEFAAVPEVLRLVDFVRSSERGVMTDASRNGPRSRSNRAETADDAISELTCPDCPS